MNTGQRKALLQSETMRRLNDGWDVIERQPFEVVLVHGVGPPWWRMALESLNPFSGIYGTSVVNRVRRRLHISVDDEGVLHRVTSGDIPRSWRRRFAWEVPDGVTGPTALVKPALVKPALAKPALVKPTLMQPGTGEAGAGEAGAGESEPSGT